MERVARFSFVCITLLFAGCQPRTPELQAELRDINLLSGEIALCGSSEERFGDVSFAQSCSEQVRADFNLATALLHSFEYTEAEKVFARIINADPTCVMAYWGAAMSNFHPLWAPPTGEELEKGSRLVTLARKVENVVPRDADYLEAVATLFDDWRETDHRTRLSRFENASEAIYKKYPDDKEAAVFYALALRAAADPSDKTFAKQLKAGDILDALFPKNPNHPGIAHYLIHTFDYPELAEKALPAARRYASIASGSAHALHMPSHIFTRLGLWEESVQSNLSSMAAAQCYAEKAGIKGHWDEEIHAIDYLVYAYLQQGRDQEALAQLDYLKSFEVVYPQSNKVAYTFAAAPARIALELRDWKMARSITHFPLNFPWERYPWESSNINFARLLGFVHGRSIDSAKQELTQLEKNYNALTAAGRNYEATQVFIQVQASRAWIAFGQGQRKKAVGLMADAAAMEDATEKHPVTPGEVIPARELLGDMLLSAGELEGALVAYEETLRKHPGRLNAIYGAAVASEKAGDHQRARQYLQQLAELSRHAGTSRHALRYANAALTN